MKRKDYKRILVTDGRTYLLVPKEVNDNLLRWATVMGRKIKKRNPRIK